MFLPIVAVTTFSQPNIDVSYCARHYLEGKQKSYSHLFICRHDGTHRRQITSGPMSAVGSLWLDRDHLAYAEVDNDTPGEFSVGQRRWKARISVLNLKTNTQRHLVSFPTDDYWAAVDEAKKTIDVGEHRYQVSLDKATNLTKNPNEEYGFGHSTGGQDDPRYEADVSETTSSPAYKLYWSQGEMDEMKDPIDGLLVTSKARSQHFTVKLGTVEQAKAAGKSSLYVVTAPCFQRLTCENWLYQLDLEKGTSTLLGDAGRIQFDVNQSLWLGTQTESRPILALKDGRGVYVNALYAGCWKESKRWTIAEGLVYVYDYHLRPNR